MNSAPYATFEERKGWILKTVGRIHREVKILYPLLAEIQLAQEEISALQKLSLRYVAHSLSVEKSSNSREILKVLEEKPFFPDKQEHQWLIPLENQMSQILHSMKLPESLSGLEYPINIRVVHGTPLPSFKLKHTYPPSVVHSDLWAGEPADSVQIIIPLMGNVQNCYCQWYEVDPHRFDHYLTNYLDYQSARDKLGEVKTISHTFDVGKMYVFDSALPHQTVQNGGGVRLSLDFRLRRLFPYADLDWISRMRRERGSYDRYYTFPPTPYPFLDFRQKLDREIEILEKLGLTSFTKLRKEEYSQLI